MAKILVFLIKIYQVFSRLFSVKACRFYPSCSHYAHEAIVKHGAMKGSFLAFKRLLRCSPFNDGGYDPVR